MKRLYRNKRHSMLGGVCSGIADYLNADPTLVRLIAALLFFVFGLSLWVYIIAWIIIPVEPY